MKNTITPLLFLGFISLTAGAAEIAPCKGSGGGKVLTVGGGGFKTIAEALKAAQPGETVLLKAGNYKGGISFPRSGSAGKCITLKGEKGAVISGGSKGITISSKNYIAIVGLTINNISGGETPTGIDVKGSSSYIELRNNLVEKVNSSKNAHGIAFYGSSSTPMSNILIDGNEIKNCRLGQSETLVLNGNVKQFQITNNKLRDNDNIGIDIIGYEGTGPGGQDYAREGTIANNTVSNSSSANNPTYGGERSAGGIYVDGGRKISIEGNTVTNSDIGIELASEHAGKTTEDIVVKGNKLSNSYQGNLMMGGYDARRGKTLRILIEGNTLSNAKDGEIILQYYTTGVTIKGNTLTAKPGRKFIWSRGSGNTSIFVSGNKYSGAKIAPPDLAAKDGDIQQLSDQGSLVPGRVSDKKVKGQSR